MKRGTRVNARLNIAVVLLESLGQRWRKYLKELRRCKKAFSEESVHDLRVATRRLISTLIVIELVLPDARARRLQKRLKRLFDALSPLRDTQVQLLTLERKLVEYPELETLLTVLRVRERNLMTVIAARILKIETASLSRAISALKSSLGQHLSRPAMRRIGMEAVLGAAAGRFMNAVSFKEHVLPARARSIHRARIAFKKLRYTLEILQPMLPKMNSKVQKSMDEYQTRMGNIQDVEVLSNLLRQFARKRTLASRRKLSGFQRELLGKKKALIAAYVQSADELYGFWKRMQKVHRS
jgi:CHAD domain-containing protein